jgi:hypothetical protein
MKVTTSAIYRIGVEADCGCIVDREYSDVILQSPLNEVHFKACPAHEPTRDMLLALFSELHAKEILDLSARAKANLERRKQQAPARIQRAEAPKPTAPANPLGKQPAVAGIEGEQVTVTPLKPRPGAVRTALGGNPQRGFARAAQPTNTEILAAKGAAPGARTASVSAAQEPMFDGGLEIDLEGGDEDPRIVAGLAALQDELDDEDEGEFVE